MQSRSCSNSFRGGGDKKKLTAFHWRGRQVTFGSTRRDSPTVLELVESVYLTTFLQASFADPVGQFHTRWRNNKGKGRPDAGDKSGRESEILLLLLPSVVLCFSVGGESFHVWYRRDPEPPSFFLIDLGRRLLLTFFSWERRGSEQVCPSVFLPPSVVYRPPPPPFPQGKTFLSFPFLLILPSRKKDAAEEREGGAKKIPIAPREEEEEDLSAFDVSSSSSSSLRLRRRQQEAQKIVPLFPSPPLSHLHANHSSWHGAEAPRLRWGGRGRFWGPRPRCEQSQERLGVTTSLCQRGALPILPVFEKWCYKTIVCKSKGPKPGSFPCISRVSIRKRSIILTFPENNGVLDSQCHVCTGGENLPFPSPGVWKSATASSTATVPSLRLRTTSTRCQWESSSRRLDARRRTPPEP